MAGPTPSYKSYQGNVNLTPTAQATLIAKPTVRPPPAPGGGQGGSSGKGGSGAGGGGTARSGTGRGGTGRFDGASPYKLF